MARLLFFLLLSSTLAAFSCELDKTAWAQTTKPPIPVGKPGQPISGFQLTAKTEKGVVSAGEPIWIEVALKNTSDKILSFSTVRVNQPANAQVKDSKGEAVPRTDYLSRPLDAISMNSYALALLRLQPGQETRYRILINRLYDMTRSDAYTITINRVVSDGPPDQIGRIVSNPVQVRVVEPPDYNSYTTLSENTQSQARLEAAPNSEWKENDIWTLDVNLYTTQPQTTPAKPGAAQAPPATAPDDKAEPQLISHYTMKVKVAGTEDIGENGGYWQLDFIPSRDAPSSVRDQSYRVLVSKKDGLARALIGLRGYGNPTLEKGPTLTFSPAIPFGYPMELFPLDAADKTETAPSRLQLSLKTQTSGAERVVEAALSRPNREQPEAVVKQTWTTGASWWSEYEKQDFKRHITLRAKLIPS